MKTLLVVISFMLSLFFNGFAQQNTVNNLQKAYQEEANAAYRFDLYSDKAYKDGYDDLSRLFCAISNAEYIHMLKHQKALQELGEKPEPVQYEEIKVTSGINNLKEAIKNEAAEKRSMSREYTREAKEESMPELAKSFRNLSKIEANHEYLLKKALFSFEKNIPEDYYVSNQTGEIIWNCKCIGKCKCEAPPTPKQPGEIYTKF